MLFLSQTTYLSWPPKPTADWASSVVQRPSLAHPNSHPSTKLSSTARWSTAPPSGLTPLPQILLRLTPWKPRPSRLLESPAMKLSQWAYHFAIADRSVVSLVFYRLLSVETTCTFSSSSFFPPGFQHSCSPLLWVWLLDLVDLALPEVDVISLLGLFNYY